MELGAGRGLSLTLGAEPGGRAGVRVPCCAAQFMFNEAAAFNQPLEAWDVGQVTTMQVRRRPSWGLGGAGRWAWPLTHIRC